MDEVKSFSEIRKQVSLNRFDEYGRRVQLEELADKVVVVRNFVEARTDERGVLYLVACELGNEKVWFFTRAPWMSKYKDYVPFKARIMKERSKRGPGNVFFFGEP